jgi:hypothetical protein
MRFLDSRDGVCLFLKSLFTVYRNYMLFRFDSFDDYSQIIYIMLKNYILFIAFLAFFQFGFSQEYEITYETKQLIEARSIYLNGGFRASMGGKSRTSIKVDLPPNTVKWYYSFSTKKGKSGIQNLNLALQLSSMILDPSTLTSQLASKVRIPDGVGSIDVYICDRENIDKFIRKADLDGGTYAYNYEGLVENTKQATIQIDDITSGTVYLGLKIQVQVQVLILV